MAHAGSGRTAGQRGQALRQPAALCGLGAGSMFALAAIAIKFATAKLAGVDTVGSALVSLVVVMTIQSVLHHEWIVARDPGTQREVGRSEESRGGKEGVSTCRSRWWPVE